MWQRTKRLINSYLDDLIERVSGPDKDVRNLTRAEVSRLNEMEVQARGAAKMFEKELAEIDLKLLGLAERDRIARERGDASASANIQSAIATLSAQRDLLKTQIGEAQSSAERARSLREQRRREGEELATETHLTAMRENLAGIQSPFDATDPASTIDEMRERLSRSSGSTIDSRIAEADRELEEQTARARVDEMLARYKQTISEGTSEVRAEDSSVQKEQAASPDPPAAAEVDKEEDPEQPKTLGRSDGNHRPID